MENIISLSGEWKFKLDIDNLGIAGHWYYSDFTEIINLPGSTDEAGFGTKTTFKDPHRLSRSYEYVGVAWYQKEISIPDEFKDKSIILFLERCHFETRVWVDGKEIGMQDSLCTPHQFELDESIKPGAHILTVRVDNTVKYNVGKDAHSVTKETQTNWNGIIGKIQLEIYDRIKIIDLQVYPDLKNSLAKVLVTIENNSKEIAQGKLLLSAKTWNTNLVQSVPEVSVTFEIEEKIKTIKVIYPISDNMLLWDEFSPIMYNLTARIDGEANNYIFNSTKSVDFGMREFKTKGTQFSINGRTTFLRGTLECCVFPLTGYPEMGADAWSKILQVAKDYGLNHIRFHSWCPPEAAFIAADQLGLMLQVETPVWATLGEDPKIDDFIYKEGDRILKSYGNHPSFCMLSVGNEPSGDNQIKFLSGIVSYWKNKDKRFVYTGCSGWPEIKENDYHCLKNRTNVLRMQDWGDELNGRLNAKPLTTDFDFSREIAGCKVPIVSHEIGQWCVYPDFKEIEQYTGVLKPRNFEVAKELLLEKGMLEQAEDFLMASGKLQTLLYKADIEAALRTPGFGGFQLLGLTDFPGQGTALVGVLNAFWKEKGYVSDKEFSRFCSEVVPLIRMSKTVWTNSEVFKAGIEFSNFGATDIDNVIVFWSIDFKDGKNLVSRELKNCIIPIGNGIKVSNIEMNLEDIEIASQLVVTVGIKGTKYSNNWNIWVYPEVIDLTQPKGIVVTQCLQDALKQLKIGKKVLFLPTADQFKTDKVAAGYTTIFWNTAWTGGQKPHTLGILCDPKNPALTDFVTDFHSNWHWFELIKDSHVMVLDGLSKEFKPIVQVIHDWNKNNKLGLLLEGKAYKGELLVCSIDLINNMENRPVARQMLYSLLKYMDSGKFTPENNIDLKQIESIFL